MEESLEICYERIEFELYVFNSTAQRTWIKTSDIVKIYLHKNIQGLPKHTLNISIRFSRKINVRKVGVITVL